MADVPLPDESSAEPPMKRTGVHARLGRAFALQIAVISVAVIAGVFAITFIVSDVLSREALQGEATHFWRRLAENPAHSLPDTDNMSGYLARDGDLGGVPEPLRAQPPGFHRIDFQGERPLVFVSDGPGGRLFLVFRQQQVSNLTLYFGVIPGAFVLLFIYALSFVTYRLSQRAVSPLVSLAQRLEAYEPMRNGAQLLDLDDLRGSADTEVATMIEALDRFTRRLEGFVLRERNFTRDASHELRTPIAVVRACLDLLERDKKRPATDAASLDRMRRAVAQMQSLIESLLLLAREDELRSLDEKTNVNAVVAEQLDLLSELARETGNTVRVVEQGNLIVDAPPRMIAIALTNLLRNALTYSRDGIVEVTVGPAFVSVRDTGAGMSAEDLQRIFEPFFRGEAARQRPAAGHGLGLAIVRRLVDQFGWSLDLASAPDNGTTVTLHFSGEQAAQGARIRNPSPGTVSINS
jgi:signal transduction histidine kinase